MQRLTYGDAKAQLARRAAVSGLRGTGNAVLMAVNRAIQELMLAGEWPGIVDQYVFKIYDGNLTLPGDLERVTAVAKSRTPYSIKSAWYEFLGWGPGPQVDYNDNVTGVLIDRGVVPTFRDIPYDEDAPQDYRLVVYSMVDERDDDGTRPTITIRGWDSPDGIWIRTEIASRTWIEGERVELWGDFVPNYQETANYFRSIASIEKPVTRGYVEVWAYTGSEAEQHITTLAPLETNANYRRYYMPSVSAGDWPTIRVRARKKYAPIVNDEDYMLISNLPALEMMLSAIASSDAGDIEKYAACRTLAVDLMKQESLTYEGTPKPVFEVDTDDEGFGVGIEYVV